MPRRFERHRREKAVYDSQPARSAELAAAVTEPAKRPKGRKDTRSWCKGKPGREHAPTVVYRPMFPSARGCQWRPDYSNDGIEWACHHQEECSACGKVLRYGQAFADSECPAYPGSDEQRQEAEREVAASAERWAAWYRRVHPPITGPQGYRRKRENAR